MKRIYRRGVLACLLSACSTEPDTAQLLRNHVSRDQSGCNFSPLLPSSPADAPFGDFSLLATVDERGVVQAVRPDPVGPPQDPKTRAAYEEAKRLLLNPACSRSLKLPRQEIGDKREITLRFHPRSNP